MDMQISKSSIALAIVINKKNIFCNSNVHYTNDIKSYVQ